MAAEFILSKDQTDAYLAQRETVFAMPTSGNVQSANRPGASNVTRGREAP